MIRPLPGPQTDFLCSRADIAIYGGAAGGGKSFGLLLEPMRNVANRNFAAVMFRRNMVQVTNPGGLWDEATKLYSRVPGAVPRMSQPMQWVFSSGAKVTFAHLDAETTVLGWQGAAIPLICFDELTHFTKSQFFYLLSRNRSMCGVRPYIRATCNPDADSWVAEFIAWWIDQETGLPILERSGVLRWFIRVGDAIYWADSPTELPVQFTPEGVVIQPKSVTFIAAKLTDNTALMTADPGYYANLMAMGTVERERLLFGNWKIRPAAGMYFQRHWCEVIDHEPDGLTMCRGWDLAATEKTETNDPDWTAGVRIGRAKDGSFVVCHAFQAHLGPLEVERTLVNIAAQDGRGCKISVPQDPGAGGKILAKRITQLLAGYVVSTSLEARGTPGSPAKVTRFSPFSAQAKAGNVRIVRGQWNEAWFTALEGFPEAAHDDYADATSRSFEQLITRQPLNINPAIFTNGAATYR